jgi:hypothetical protein
MRSDGHSASERLGILLVSDGDCESQMRNAFAGEKIWMRLTLEGVPPTWRPALPKAGA